MTGLLRALFVLLVLPPAGHAQPTCPEDFSRTIFADHGCFQFAGDPTSCEAAYALPGPAVLALLI